MKILSTGRCIFNIFLFLTIHIKYTNSACTDATMERKRQFLCAGKETMLKINNCNFELPEILKVQYDKCNKLVETNGFFDVDEICNDDCHFFKIVYECKQNVWKRITPKLLTEKDREKISRVFECVTGGKSIDLRKKNMNEK